MNSLIAFFKKNFHFFLFVILQIVSIILISNSMNYQRFSIASISQTLTAPIHKSWNKLTRHFNLEKENEYLIQQNIELMRQLENTYNFIDDSTYTQYQIDTFPRKRKIKLYDYTTANVIYLTTHKKHNYILIDKGSADGIIPDMAVLSPQGVVGIINNVSDHFSSIISILHPDSRISAKIMPINQIGIILWDDDNAQTATLHDIPQHLEVNVGDSVFTSGFSNVFPKDILIGTVINKKSNTKNSFYTIKIKIATNFSNLNRVYIVNNLYKSEIDSLKSNLKNE